jgi:hypothetical protein
MLAYQMLWKKELGLSLTDLDVNSTLCPVKVERNILKKFKTQ